MLRKELGISLERSRHGDSLTEHNALVRLLDKKEIENRACWMIAIACMIHLGIFLGVFTFILYGISKSLYPDPPEMVERNFSTLWVSAFMTMSAFTNSGYTLTSDSLMSYSDKPGVYLVLCLLILAGNTSLPLCIRSIVWCMYVAADKLGLDRDGLRFALSFPRRVVYCMFDSRQTIMLAAITASINVVEYIFFISSTLHRDEAQVCLRLSCMIPSCLLTCVHQQAPKCVDSFLSTNVARSSVNFSHHHVLVVFHVPLEVFYQVEPM
jgi:Trk-type K+ transport system membrane component